MRANYTIEMFKVQSRIQGSQVVEAFKRECLKYAADAEIQTTAYGTTILPHSAILKAVIAHRDTKKYAKIIAALGKEYSRNISASNSEIILAGLSFLPNDTTVTDLLPLLAPFRLWREIVETTLRYMVEVSKQVYAVDLCAGLDNIIQRKELP